jgi:hypothetical protein
MTPAAATIASTAPDTTVRITFIVARNRCTRTTGKRSGCVSSSIGGSLGGSGVGLGFEGEGRTHDDGRPYGLGSEVANIFLLDVEVSKNW